MKGLCGRVESGFEVEKNFICFKPPHELVLKSLSANRWPSERRGSTLHMAAKSGSVESSTGWDSTNGCWTSQSEATAGSAGLPTLRRVTHQPAISAGPLGSGAYALQEDPLPLLPKPRSSDTGLEVFLVVFLSFNTHSSLLVIA